MLKRILVRAPAWGLLAALLLGSCSGGKPEPTAPAAEPAQGGRLIVAEVNGTPIYSAELRLGITRFEHQLASGGLRRQPDNAQALGDTALQTLIENELLVQEARRRGFKAVPQEVDEELAAIASQFPGEGAFEASLSQMEVTREDLLRDLERAQTVGKMIAADIAPGVTVSAQEVRAYYDANPAQFTEPERVRARHIFLKVVPGTTEEQKAEMRRTLEKLRERVLQGESFEALAEQYSQDPNSGQGGDLGYLLREGLSNDMEQVVFGLQKGQLSGVFKSVYGYHLFQAVDHPPPARVSFERVQASLSEYLRTRKVDQAVSALAAELRAKAKIVIPE